MKRRKLVIGNWKMNPESTKDARAIFLAIKKSTSRLKNVDTVICPPFVFLADLLSRNARNKKVFLGAQDVFSEFSGAFTGEVSPTMLESLGARYVIIGHSERRALGETDELINKKILSAIRADLTVILCIGEKEHDKDMHYLEFVKNQIKLGLVRVNRPQLSQVVIAYEPVWAIGQKEAMTPALLHEMVIFIRRVLSDIYGSENAVSVPILYGGSVTPENTAGLISAGNADGLLVGRESRDPKSFSQILSVVDAL